jgi:hypothetical protein
MRKVVHYDQIYLCAKFGNFWSIGSNLSYFTNGEVFEYWKILGILKRMKWAWPL